MKLHDGLVAISDGRITSGLQLSSACKTAQYGTKANRFFIMHSGLRSLRDKALAYLAQDLAQYEDDVPETMLEAVGAFTKALRRVAAEDREALEAADLRFNAHALVGGMLAGDTQPSLFLVYPEGNWINADARTPSLAIGATAYGKSLVERLLTADLSLATATKLACLAFESTRVCTADVGFPLDVIVYRSSDRSWRTVTLAEDDLAEQRHWWRSEMSALIGRIPDGCLSAVLPPPAPPYLSLVTPETA